MDGTIQPKLASFENKIEDDQAEMILPKCIEINYANKANILQLVR